MKRTLLIGLAFGLALTALSLSIKTGSKHVDPMSGCDACVHGVAVRFPGKTISSRGFPLPILAITVDDDSPNRQYWAYNVSGTLVDLLIFTTLSTAVVIGARKLSNR